MCGRYSLLFDAGPLEERFDAVFEDDHEPRYNAAPGQELPVVTGDEPAVITRQQWGLVPGWADEGFDGIVNARAETIDEKPSFREAYRNRRCLVLADGFYEWAETEGRTQPYRFTLPDGDPFAMAGLWERWTPDTTQAGLDDFAAGGGPDDEQDATVETFTIVTTAANDHVSDLHDRMPVVLPPGAEDRWLDAPDPDLLEPYDGEMRAYPVSTAVNDPSNDSPAVVEAIDT